MVLVARGGQSRRIASAVIGAAVGIIAGGFSLAVVDSAIFALIAVGAGMGVSECATFGAIIGSITGAVGGAIGGWARGATCLPATATRTAVASSLAALFVLGPLWGTGKDKLMILGLALLGLTNGVAIGDLVARRIAKTKPRDNLDA